MSIRCDIRGSVAGTVRTLSSPPCLVGHPEHADGPAGDEAPGERRLLEQDQGVERVAVLAEGVLDVAVVRRIAGGGEEHPVQADASGGMVQLVLVPLALRDFYRHVELHAPSVSHGGPVPFGGVAFLGVGTITSSGSTIVTAKTGRFRRRLAMGIIGLVLLLVGGGVGAGVLLTGRSPTTAPRRSPSPRPSCPSSATPSPCWPPSPTDAPGTRPRRPRQPAHPAAHRARPRRGVSAEVVDVATGEVLLDLDADDPATPASTAKLLTAAAALSTLDPVRHPGDDGRRGATPGEVVLVGGGDPTLSRTAPSQTYPGAPTVADLATQVAGRHARRHPGHPHRRRQLAVQRPADRQRLGRRPTPPPATPRR